MKQLQHLNYNEIISVSGGNKHPFGDKIHIKVFHVKNLDSPTITITMPAGKDGNDIFDDDSFNQFLKLAGSASKKLLFCVDTTDEESASICIRGKR